MPALRHMHYAAIFVALHAFAMSARAIIRPALCPPLLSILCPCLLLLYAAVLLAYATAMASEPPSVCPLTCCLLLLLRDPLILCLSSSLNNMPLRAITVFAMPVAIIRARLHHYYYVMSAIHYPLSMLINIIGAVRYYEPPYHMLIRAIAPMPIINCPLRHNYCHDPLLLLYQTCPLYAIWLHCTRLLPATCCHAPVIVRRRLTIGYIPFIWYWAINPLVHVCPLLLSSAAVAIAVVGCPSGLRLLSCCLLVRCLVHIGYCCHYAVCPPGSRGYTNIDMATFAISYYATLAPCPHICHAATLPCHRHTSMPSGPCRPFIVHCQPLMPPRHYYAITLPSTLTSAMAFA